VREALFKALEAKTDASVDRILAAAFYRSRPLQAGSRPGEVVRLADRRHAFLDGNGGSRR
jgi:hypothetical protein